MIKIPTMFERDETQRGHPVMNRLKPECQWVADGEGVATAKLDGTNLKVENGVLLKRQKPKSGDYDEACYARCDRANPSDQWAFEALDRLILGPSLDSYEGLHGIRLYDGIYELIGPKVQGNPHHSADHVLVRVVPPSQIVRLMAVRPPRDFDGLRTFFAGEMGGVFEFEGIVFHHQDGRLAKIKRRDFGLPWPVSPQTEARP